jgi:hypothetical protein
MSADVSEEYIASIIIKELTRPQTIMKHVTSIALPYLLLCWYLARLTEDGGDMFQCLLTFNELRCVLSQKTRIHITTAVIASNLTWFHYNLSLVMDKYDIKSVIWSLDSIYICLFENEAQSHALSISTAERNSFWSHILWIKCPKKLETRAISYPSSSGMVYTNTEFMPRNCHMKQNYMHYTFYLFSADSCGITMQHNCSSFK